MKKTIFAIAAGALMLVTAAAYAHSQDATEQQAPAAQAEQSMEKGGMMQFMHGMMQSMRGMMHGGGGERHDQMHGQMQQMHARMHGGDDGGPQHGQGRHSH